MHRDPAHKSYQSLNDTNAADEKVNGNSNGNDKKGDRTKESDSISALTASQSSSSSSPPSSSTFSSNLSTQFELVTAFYELEDVRIPPSLRSLKLFYVFFLAVGIPIGKVQIKSKSESEAESESDTQAEVKWRSKLNSKSDPISVSNRSEGGGGNRVDETHDDDDEVDLTKFGTAPVYSTNPGWIRMYHIQYIHTALCMLAVVVYTVMSCHQAMQSTTRFLRIIFTICLIASVLASVALAHDVLTRRLIGTKIYYALANTSGRNQVTSQINFTLYIQLFICVCLAAVGTLADCTANQRNEQLRGSVIAWTLWSLSSFIVNLQLVSGVAVFGGVAGVHLIRIESSTRLLKRPGTTVKTALAHLFDIDVSLSDLSQILDFRLTFLLVTSFLSFFFQSIALSNEQKDRNQDDDGSYWDLLSLVHPGFVAAYILAGCSTLNSAAQHMKSVAFRYGIFQQRVQTHQLQKQQQQKKKEESHSRSNKHSTAFPGESRDTDRIYRLMQKKEAEGSNEKDGSRTATSKTTSKADQSSSFDSAAAVAQAASDALSDSGSENENEGDSQSEDKETKPLRASNQNRPQSKSKSKSKAKAKAKMSAAVEMSDPSINLGQSELKSNNDKKHSKDEEEDEEEQENSLYLNQLFSYLGQCDVSFRLANIQLDSSIVWGFVVVSTSAVFSLLDIDQLSFL